MKISLDWLSDFVTWTEKDPARIADRLTLCTAEVEEVETQGALLNHCCVGKVLTKEKHPSADRLCICTVETDKGTKTVVCGGTNVDVGMLVAFAHVGATVKWHGGELMTLEPVKIRGVASEGMICAGEELGLEGMFPPKPEDGERPIIDLTTHDSRLTPGADLRTALNLTDTILHINNTAITTRPDLFSHIGFARECVALGLAKWKKEPNYTLPKFPSKKGNVHIAIDAAKQVHRYLGCNMSIDGLGETPEWMKKRLGAVGIRSISLPVDITNYVMLEVGVPMHCFDADDIHGDVHLRLSKKGEKIQTLDGKELTLPADALIMSDDKGVFDLLGIMGGLRSSTTEKTRNIFVHGLSLDSASIRRAVLATNHRTDASTVYEKGVPPVTTEQGFIRTVELFRELVPGATLTSSLENAGTNGKPTAITLSVERIHTLIGANIPEKQIVKILEDLGCEVQGAKKKTNPKSEPAYPSLLVTPPLHRTRDIGGAHDLIEEIGRVYGYDNVTEQMPAANIQIPVRDRRIHQLRDALKAATYMETVPLSFISRELLKKAGFEAANAVEIENPLGDETALLQTSTLPHLLSHAQNNLLQAGTLRTFHWSHVFERGLPERLELSLLTSTRESSSLLDDPFLQTKEDVITAAQAAGYNLTIAPAKVVPASAHPGRIADIMFGKEVIGQVFEIHPEIRKRFDIAGRAAAATINLHALFAHPVAHRSAEPLPTFPSVTYDVTFTKTHHDAIGALLEKAKHGNALLETVVVHDLYTGKPLTNEQYNVTLRFTYRSPEKTLTEDEAKKAHEQVLQAIK